MAVEVDYVQFSGGANANVLAPAAYQARGEVQTGVQPGVADPQLANTSWRHGTMGTAVLANFIAQTINVNMLDDGNVQGFVQNFKSALSTILVTATPPLYSGTDSSNTVNTITATNVTPALTGPVNGGLYVIRNNNTNTGPMQMALNGGTSYPCVKSGGAAMAGLECKKNDWSLWTFTGAAYEFVGDQTISNSVTLYPTTIQQLQQIIVALSTLNTASNAQVLIQLPAGTFPLTSITGPLSFAHACGLQINLIGAPLSGAFPTATQLGNANSAVTLTLLQSIFQTVITTVGVNALEVRGFLGSVQNILFVGDGTASGGHYGALVGNWSTSQPAIGTVKMINCWFHGFGLDNVRAENQSLIQVNNVGSTYATSHGYHISHFSVLECNVGNVLAMHAYSGCQLQNSGMIAIDSASGTCDFSYNTFGGIASQGIGIVNAYASQGLRIQNNQYGIVSQVFGSMALPAGGQTTFSGNQIDVNIAFSTYVVTYGCALPSGSSPSRGGGFSGTYALVV